VLFTWSVARWVTSAFWASAWAYLYIGLTTANAFRPTDTLPLTHWAKVAMAIQALISFVIVGLVIARAVNVFA